MSARGSPKMSPAQLRRLPSFIPDNLDDSFGKLQRTPLDTSTDCFERVLEILARIRQEESLYTNPAFDELSRYVRLAVGKARANQMALEEKDDQIQVYERIVDEMNVVRDEAATLRDEGQQKDLQHQQQLRQLQNEISSIKNQMREAHLESERQEARANALQAKLSAAEQQARIPVVTVSTPAKRDDPELLASLQAAQQKADALAQKADAAEKRRAVLEEELARKEAQHAMTADVQVIALEKDNRELQRKLNSLTVLLQEARNETLTLEEQLEQSVANNVKTTGALEEFRKMNNVLELENALAVGEISKLRSGATSPTTPAGAVSFNQTLKDVEANAQPRTRHLFASHRPSRLSVNRPPSAPSMRAPPRAWPTGGADGKAVAGDDGGAQQQQRSASPPKAFAKLSNSLRALPSKEKVAKEVHQRVLALKARFNDAGIPLPLEKMGPCQYKLNKQTLMMNVLSGKLVVRIGGGFEDFTHFLERTPY
eukprot:TRINITY_DN6324_c0_g1_i1.p1 TRINITY_DN6324_c0_g1~~TRINITY_DN6324_c0_g1_i1.p1  ORF type:complete len:485 (-),score=145.02 TRINITY_DN6324_c0_g1_i1:344-1798(-)